MKFKLYNLLLEHPCKFFSEKVLHFAIFCYLCSKLFEHAKANVRNSNTDPTPNPSPTREGRGAQPSYERGERGAAILQGRGEGRSHPTREGRGVEPSYEMGEGLSHPTREGRGAELSYKRGKRGGAILQERGEGLSYPTRKGRGAEPSYKGGENRRESRLSPLSPPFKGRGWGWGL